MGKQGLCVNVKDPRGLDLLNKLIAKADVFIENYRPGALDKLGLGYEQLSGLNPRLIYCSVSAYGHTGPDSKRPGFGLIAEARSGVMAQIGRPGETPPLLRIPVADMYTGAHGVAAVCAALFGRERSGRRQHIDLALYDCMISIHDYAVQQYANDGPLPVQTGSDQPESTVYGVFPARDGYLVVAAQVEESWKRLAALIGGPELAADPRFHGQTNRNANRLAALESIDGQWRSPRARRAWPPRGQTEAARALGLRTLPLMLRVVLPQAFRLSLAPTVGFLVQLVKGTSLASIIGFVELSRAAQIVSSTTYKPLLAYGVAGLFYFAICFPLSRVSARLERRFALHA